MNNHIKLDNSNLFMSFDEHFSDEDNTRILFSAPFGAGKSTYLAEYFKKNNDKYFGFNLYPVTYSISHNEDVFELIKFDLLLQLMGNYKNEINLINEDFSNILSFQALFLKEIKLTPILLSLLEESGKVGKSAKILIDGLKTQYKEYKETFNNEEKFIENYLQNFENRLGQVNEMDGYSSIICSLIKRVKLKNTTKKSVLIIDDLDRLDPEHIFRLFNIFSVNFGKEKVLNKFGFDKIIFVCDIENIKNIYKHKYGNNVDFSGYIDKFYSKNPFEFDNLELIGKSLNLFIESIDDESNSLFGSEGIDREEIKYIQFEFLKAFLYTLLNNKMINLRMLHSNKYFYFESHEFIFFDKIPRQTGDFPIIKMFHILKNYIGTFTELKNILDRLEVNLTQKDFSSDHNLYEYDHKSFKNLFSLCLPFLFDENKNSEISNPQNVILEQFNCSIEFNRYNSYCSVRNIASINQKNKSLNINPYKVLNYVFDDCVKRGAIVL